VFLVVKYLRINELDESQVSLLKLYIDSFKIKNTFENFKILDKIKKTRKTREQNA